MLYIVNTMQCCGRVPLANLSVKAAPLQNWCRLSIENCLQVCLSLRFLRNEKS